MFSISRDNFDTHRRRKRTIRKRRVPVSVQRETNGNARAVVIYDGQCEFCTRQAHRMAGGGRSIVLRSFHDPGVLDDYPGLTFEMCMEGMKLIDPHGKIFDGAEAVIHAIAIRHRFAGAIPLLLYNTPGVRWIADRVYAWVARNRYRIMGRSEECETGRCRLHRHSRISE